MPLHNKRFGELSNQLSQKVDMLSPALQKLPMIWDRARTVDGLWTGTYYPTFPIITVSEWTLNLAGVDFTSCEHGRLSDLFNGSLQLRRRCHNCQHSFRLPRGRYHVSFVYFLARMGRSYMGLVNAQGKFK